MNTNSITEKIIKEFADLIEPLSSRLEDPSEFISLMREFGWNFSFPNVPNATNFKNIPTHLEELYEVIATIYNAKTDEEKIASLFDLTAKFFVVFNDVKDLSQFLDSTNIPDNLPTGITSEKFLTQFGEDFFYFIITEYLKNYHPFIFGFFSFAGIVKLEQVDAEENGGRLAYIRRTVEWDKLSLFLNNPSSALGSIIKWNTEDFSAEEFFDFLQDILVEMGIPAGKKLPNLTVAENMDMPETSLADIENILQIPIYQVADPDIGYAEAGIDVYPLPKTNSELPGIALFPFLSGGVNFQIELGSNLILEIRGGLSTGVAILLRPGSADAKANLFGTSGSSLSASVSSSIFTPPSEEKNVILGDPAGTNLSYREVSNTVGIKVGNTFDLFYELNITGLRLEIRSAEGDGFISQVMPEEITADFDLILGLSKSRGFYIKGSGAIEITIPVRKSLGPIFLESIYLSLRLEEDGRTIKIILAATGNITLGPIAASVERLGLELKLPLKSGTKNILDNVQISFKPPSLVGLSLDAGPVSGGGALLFDPDNKRYGGILQLDIEGFVTITAIGVITTELPDGSDGFSLLGIISIEFDPGFQVGAGLVFLGLGGYLGVHRTMDTEALRDGLKKGDLDTLLFPEGDLIARAPQIISDIETIFPAAKDRFLVGIAVKLGWPTPTIISAEIGVILEFPSPLTIAVLGQLTIALPDPDEALLKLRLDILGIIKFDPMSVTIEGALFDSHIISMPITGEMALLARGGRNPAFIHSVGGFYPGFNKFPTGFRAPTERMAVSLSTGSNPRMRLEAYFAITSNTVQFGAALDLYAEAGPFSLAGYLKFNALFQFSPFYFTTSFGAGIALKYNSKSIMEISLDLNLSGPSPWHAKGKATFKFLFIDASVSFDEKFGQKRQQIPSFVNPDNDLISALKDYRNWSAQLPAEESRIITTREIKSMGETEISREIENMGETENSNEFHPITLHPWGQLTVKQSLMPFGIKIVKAGSSLIEGGKRFYKLENVKLNDDSANINSYVRDDFAAANYLSLTDSEKLSRESYEKWKCGVTIGSDDISFGTVVDKDFTFETTVYVSENEVDPLQNISPKHMKAMISSGACALSKTRHTGKKKFQGKKMGMKLDDAKYVIVKTSDMTIEKIEDIDQKDIDQNNPLTYTEAVQALQRFLDDNPQRENELRVLPLHQAVITV